MRGELDFTESLTRRVRLLAGLPEAALAEVYEHRLRLNPGAERLMQGLKAAGIYTILVSGGFTYFTERVAAAAGFAEHRANHLLFEDGALNGKVTEPILGRAAKLQALIEIAGQIGAGTDAALAVGDGANDISMVEAAGLGVAYHAKPALEDKADAVIRYSDLTALLHLQGYSEEEFHPD